MSMDGISREKLANKVLRYELTLPTNFRLYLKKELMDFATLVRTLEMRFGEKCMKEYSRFQQKTCQQKSSESHQELVIDIDRLFHRAFPDCPTDIRVNLAL